MAEQRKATDASGKGIENEGRGGVSNYKPKMPGRGSKAGPAARGSAAKEEPIKAKGAIPKWKL